MLLKSEKLRFAYTSNRELHFPPLELHAGEAVLITGPSGVGKTTWLHLLCGLLKPSQGKLSWQNQLTPKQVLRELVSYQPQLPSFFHHLSGIQNLQRLGYLNGTAEEKGEILIQALGLETILHAKPHTWSAGEQQRMNAAQAILRPCPIIFADEPTAHLDNDACQLVVDQYLMELKRGRSLVVVSHDVRIHGIFTKHLQL